MGNRRIRWCERARFALPFAYRIDSEVQVERQYCASCGTNNPMPGWWHALSENILHSPSPESGPPRLVLLLSNNKIQSRAPPPTDPAASSLLTRPRRSLIAGTTDSSPVMPGDRVLIWKVRVMPGLARGEDDVVASLREKADRIIGHLRDGANRTPARSQPQTRATELQRKGNLPGAQRQGRNILTHSSNVNMKFVRNSATFGFTSFPPSSNRLPASPIYASGVGKVRTFRHMSTWRK